MPKTEGRESDSKVNMQHARNGLVHTSDDEEVVVVPRAPAHMHPPPIEPYHPEPKYTIDTIVTPCTIIPTCYFRIVSIGWNAHEQAHYYSIRSLPQLGEQRKLIRTLEEWCGSASRFSHSDLNDLYCPIWDGKQALIFYQPVQQFANTS
jgi:hypothetical protein